MKIITGMHRSGTSAVARLFFEAGAPMGNSKTFYPPDRWNPEGYYEQKDIHGINMPLINGSWGRFAYLRLPSAETIERRARQMSEKIAKTSRDYENQIVKENRFCLTLNAWRMHGEKISHILFCLREPGAIARSLFVRNRLPVNFSLGLWYEHCSRFLEQAGKIPIAFIHYDRLFEESSAVREIIQAFSFLGISLSEKEAPNLWKRALKPGMNHHKMETFTYPSKITALWRELSERHRKQFADA